MTDALTRYDAARQALAEAVRVDEVKVIRNMAVAMQAYARQARDYTLAEQATEIRLRAERRAGELLIVMATTGERAKPGDAGGGTDGSGARPSVAPTLKVLGISKTESSHWQGLASLDDAAFELRVQAMKKQAVSRTALNNVGIRERRHEREAGLGARQYALPSRRYGVVLRRPAMAL
jgi:hypothetical protein